MAKKEETISLIDTFSEFKELKNIDRTTMVSVLEESFRSVIAKMFGTDENYDVIVNPDTVSYTHLDQSVLFGMPAVNLSFILPFICFVVVTIYGHRSYKRMKKVRSK